MKRIVPVILAFLLLCGCATNPSEPTQVTTPTETVDNTAPDFTMYTYEGEKVKLSDLQGKPVILNFWASWCGPCKKEMPALESAYQEYGDRIHFVIVNLTDGTNETLAQASAYIKGQGYTFPVYYDLELAGATAYGVSSIPFTLFIDAQGKMQAYYTGSMSEQILQSGINILLPVSK